MGKIIQSMSGLVGGAGGASGFVAALLALQPSVYYDFQTTNPALPLTDKSSNNGPSLTFNLGGGSGVVLGVADNPITSQPGLVSAQFISDQHQGGGGYALLNTTPGQPGDSLWRPDSEPWSVVLWVKPTEGFFIPHLMNDGTGSWRELSINSFLDQNIQVMRGDENWNSGQAVPVGAWSMLTVVLGTTDTYVRVNKTEVARGQVSNHHNGVQTTLSIPDGDASVLMAHLAIFKGKALTKAQTDALYDVATAAPGG